MGEIVLWTLLRTVLAIILIWLIQDYWDYKFFWVAGTLFIYFFVIFPAIQSYKNFVQKNKPVVENSLCSSCRHFDESAVLCMKYDKHPSQDYIPCDGIAWEPKN